MTQRADSEHSSDLPQASVANGGPTVSDQIWAVGKRYGSGKTMTTAAIEHCDECGTKLGDTYYIANGKWLCGKCKPLSLSFAEMGGHSESKGAG